MNKSPDAYRQFTKPAELHKAINTLKGLVTGITSDGHLSDSEAMELANWCALRVDLQDRNPFSELIPVIKSALRDNTLDENERKDLLWICENFNEDCKYYDAITSSVQFLFGIIHGIMADGSLTDSEINGLLDWLEQNSYLQGTYPFDEVNSLINATIADGQISEDERNRLMAFFSTIVDFKDSWNLRESDFEALRGKYSIDGICAICPEISFENKVFCITGESKIYGRKEFISQITSLGGIYRPSVSKKANYLIVGDAGNPCWVYACYGRKVEEAIALRKTGIDIQIINERDFWDAVQDKIANIEN